MHLKILTDVFDLLDKAEQNLFAVSESNLRRSFEDMPSLIKQAIQDIESAKDSDQHLRGVPSGYVDLDRITSGWQKSDLIILAADHQWVNSICFEYGTKCSCGV